jgi:hypothetical protein
VPLAAFILAVTMAQSIAHIDAVRVSLSQLFLTAELVAIVRIESLEERSFALGETTTRHEVVTASVLSQYKGEPLPRVEFFQDAHGHAYYQSGDLAAIFLQHLSTKHPLYGIGQGGGIKFVSNQVRNSEHRIAPEDLEDYAWVLASYANPSTPASSGIDEQTEKIKQTIFRMMASNSPDMIESALLDWETTGNRFPLNEADIAFLLALTNDPEKPISLRLALLRAMSRRNLTSDEAWTELFDYEDEGDLLQILKATHGHEHRKLMSPLVTMLDHPSGDVAEGAARALGHPTYAGAEPALAPLLNSDNLRLNYAAISALLGINSDQARLLLESAATNHPNAKVRRLITARLNLVS